MKKFILGIILSIVLALPLTAIALDIGTGENSLLRRGAGRGGYSDQTTDTTLAANIGFVIKTALSFAGVIFMVLMVYAGYLWMTARGEEAKVDKSIEIIKAAVIGMVITVGAYSITNFIVPRILERTAGGGGAEVGVCCIGRPATATVDQMTFIAGEVDPAVCNAGTSICPTGYTLCSGTANMKESDCQ